MVYYIRLLKTPQVGSTAKGDLTVSFVITITTDLGEAFFPEDVILRARLLGERETHISTSHVSWRAGARVSKAQMALPREARSRALVLHVCALERAPFPEGLAHVSKIIPVWSAPFSSEGMPADSLVERRFRLSDNLDICIWEETKDSIARHIWDAAVGCLILFHKTVTEPIASTPMLFLRQLLQDTANKGIDVLELGAGCGIAGIALATLFPRCQVLLTDLPEAQDIMKRNINSTPASIAARLKQEVLEWETAGETELSDKSVDLIVVCDCIYNADSDPSLVGVLQSFMKQFPTAKILVATKRRHYSETIFFELMDETEMRVLEKSVIPLPHHPSDADTSTPEVEMYLYGLP